MHEPAPAGAGLRWGFALGALATIALILFGAATTPGFFHGGSGWVGVSAASGMAGLYGAAGVFGLWPRRYNPEILSFATPFGLAAGGVYALEIGLEYALRPADNTPWGLTEFGLVFASFVATGALVTIRTGRVRSGVLAGLWTAMLSSLIWYAVLLLVSLSFRGTAAQDAVFRAEGDFEDFRRAGLHDFNIFIMQDFLGAGFYHLLLSPLFGLALGAAGALPVAVARRFGPAGRSDRLR